MSSVMLSINQKGQLNTIMSNIKGIYVPVGGLVTRPRAAERAILIKSILASKSKWQKGLHLVSSGVFAYFYRNGCFEIVQMFP